mgnify:CR=1 FL=1
MIKLSVTSLCLSLSLACLPLTSNAALPAQSDSAKMPSYPFSLSCSKDGFRGEARGHYYNYGQNGRSVYVDQYRILNADPDRNKANVNTTIANASGGGSKSFKSPDSMKQDGQWHDLGDFWHSPWPATQVRVEFVFDKKGGDPRCDGWANLG